MVSIPSASFFSFATTFSLPGITTYSVSKSFSTSTPSVLLGRSFTWPSDASTVKPLPRYFWMVFALAGDSTITKPLVNVSSVDYYAFCETSTNAVAATSGRPRLSALSCQLSACEGTKPAYVLLRWPLQKVADNQWPARAPDHERAGDGTQVHWPSPSQSAGSAQIRNHPFDRILRQCSLR